METNQLFYIISSYRFISVHMTLANIKKLFSAPWILGHF